MGVSPAYQLAVAWAQLVTVNSQRNLTIGASKQTVTWAESDYGTLLSSHKDPTLLFPVLAAFS